jgi:hypothetical protein
MGHLRTRKHTKNKRCYKIESFTHRPTPPSEKTFHQICSIDELKTFAITDAENPCWTRAQRL